MFLNCGRENFGGFNVKQINSKNGDAVIYNSIMGENLCVFPTLLLAGFFFILLCFGFLFFFYYLRFSFFFLLFSFFVQRWAFWGENLIQVWP